MGYVRLLFPYLVKEAEVHRASGEEGKMDVKQGKTKTTCRP